MRVKLREVVSLDHPVDISSLPPMQKLYVAFMVRWRETSYYKRKKEQELEAQYREKIKREEKLKEELLNVIYTELVKGTTLKSKGGHTCSKVVLAVNREYEEELASIINGKEFISFSIRVLDMNRDMLLSFPKLPILIEVTSKVIGG
jgi:hypothetical protein